MAAQRLQWMDFIRGLCILLVIFVHASGVTRDVAGLDFPAAFTAFNEFMDPFRIPLLMFLSGMLLHKSLSKPTKDYVWGKFHLIFWPFLIWSMATYAAEQRLTLEFILKTPISAPSVLWYLWFLCAFYLLALPLVRMKVPLLPVIVACVIASEFLPSLLRIDRFASLFAFFLLGHYLVDKALTGRVVLPLALAGAVAAGLGGWLSVVGDQIKYDPLYVWVPLGLIAFILWAAPFFRPTAVTAPFEWIGRNSIVFYAVHFPLLVVSARLFPQPEALGGGVFYILLFAWVIVICSIMQLLRLRFRAVAALFDFRKLLSLLNLTPGQAAAAPPRQ